jgi:methyl-accepting chemotaxis protein
MTITRFGNEGAEFDDVLEVARARSAQYLALGLCVLGVLAVGASLLAGTGALLITGLAAGLAAFALLGAHLKNGTGRIMVAAGLIRQTICITAAFAGHPWQLDSHMIFFAVLAICLVMSDTRVIIVAAAIIAIHHLSLSVAFPVLVYPSTDLWANLERTAFHGVIVVAEAAVLWFSIDQRNTAYRNSLAAPAEIASSARRATDALDKAEAARLQTETALAEAEASRSEALEATAAAKAEVARAVAADIQARDTDARASARRKEMEAE